MKLHIINENSTAFRILEYLSKNKNTNRSKRTASVISRKVNSYLTGTYPSFKALLTFNLIKRRKINNKSSELILTPKGEEMYRAVKKVKDLEQMYLQNHSKPLISKKKGGKV